MTVRARFIFWHYAQVYYDILCLLLCIVARYTAKLSHIGSPKRNILTGFPRSNVITKNLQITVMLASLETTSPMPLLAEHRYRPASSLVTAVKWSDREFSPFTNPSVINTALPSCLHEIRDGGLLDTLQFSKPECVSLICTSVVSIVGSSFEHSNLDNREQRVPKVLGK